MTTDVDKAVSLLDDLLAPRGVRENKSSMLERAYHILTGREGNDWVPPDVRKRWNNRRRRIRAIFDAEARRVDHWEIEDLHAVIEARKRHAAYREETTRLVAMARAKAADRDG